MTVSSVGIEEVRAAVDVALDELRESLRKVNQEVSNGNLHNPSLAGREGFVSTNH